ncbi:glycerophosphodiester phosphodiesterase [Thermoleophilum album]|jgi:glycerophosphoryl diester phosphodiesterase|uniref:glycerophosphodiester phosphodiesterase n=1 Tax=Thermoleophilum album TaxID=29539 RepID=UPI00237CF509|nr:glycerophosphodiester phosphodiesterase [Thermoleophilum album]WDT93579.1 glycerophosphodiester phosphodiesterase [Thermoleophilum album]
MSTAFKRVGHKGAAAHAAPGNTIASFEAALALGVDMIEFDVLRDRRGRLVLAHDAHDLAAREPLTLDAALDHLADARYAGIELDVDLKLPGYEREVLAAVRERGLLERTLFSSTWPESLRALAAAAPGARRGLSVPRVRRDYTKTVLAVPAYAVVQWWRRRLPARAARALAAGLCHALMVHRLLVGRRLVESVRAAGGELYVWTVDSAAEIVRFAELGVDGVITNDPALFATLAPAAEHAP